MTVTYAVELTDGKFFVDKARDLGKAILAHFNSDEKVLNNWCLKHTFKRLLGTIDGDAEKTMTLAMMEAFGWENVRGHAWCQVDLKKPPVFLKRWRDEV